MKEWLRKIGIFEKDLEKVTKTLSLQDFWTVDDLLNDQLINPDQLEVFGIQRENGILIYNAIPKPRMFFLNFVENKVKNHFQFFIILVGFCRRPPLYKPRPIGY